MSLSREIVLELMAYADGELDAQDEARVEALLAENDEARRFIEGVEGDAARAVSAWLEEATAIATARAGADRVADAVMARIAAEELKPKVVGLAEARARRAARGRVAIGVAAALALAASVVLYVTSQGTGSQTPASVAQVAQPTPPAKTVAQMSTASPAAPAREEGIEVNEVESPSDDVSVFYVKGSANAAAPSTKAKSVVIWIGDDGTQAAPKGGK